MATRSGPILALGIVIIGLLVAGFLPTFVDDPRHDRQLETTQSVSSEITVYNNLNATVDSVTATNATVTLENVVTGNTSTVTVDDGSFQTTTIDESALNVSVSEVNSGANATLTYTYPPTFGWEDGPRFIVGNLGITLIGLLAFCLFLMLIKAF